MHLTFDPTVILSRSGDSCDSQQTAAVITTIATTKNFCRHLKGLLSSFFSQPIQLHFLVILKLLLLHHIFALLVQGASVQLEVEYQVVHGALRVLLIRLLFVIVLRYVVRNVRIVRCEHSGEVFYKLFGTQLQLIFVYIMKNKKRALKYIKVFALNTGYAEDMDTNHNFLYLFTILSYIQICRHLANQHSTHHFY